MCSDVHSLLLTVFPSWWTLNYYYFAYRLYCFLQIAYFETFCVYVYNCAICQGRKVELKRKRKRKTRPDEQLYDIQFPLQKEKKRGNSHCNMMSGPCPLKMVVGHSMWTRVHTMEERQRLQTDGEALYLNQFVQLNKSKTKPAEHGGGVRTRFIWKKSKDWKWMVRHSVWAWSVISIKKSKTTPAEDGRGIFYRNPVHHREEELERTQVVVCSRINCDVKATL